jgi:hypothetical protein
MPDAPALELAFRRATARTLVDHLPEIVRHAQEQALRVKVPEMLAQTIKAQLETDPKLSWDNVVASLAREQDYQIRG